MTRACLRYAREGQNVTQAGPKCHTSRAEMSHKGQNVTQSCYNDYLTKSHWHVHAIWQHRPGSTLAQVMAHSLTAPSHYLNQCGLIIVFYGIHLGAIDQEVPMNCIRLYPTQNLPYLTGRTMEGLCRLIRFKSVDVNLENVHSFNRFEGYLECIN